MGPEMKVRTMKYDAVIFDLFGTLVDNFGGGYTAALRKDGVLAELAGDRSDEFSRLWGGDDGYRMRILGRLETPADSIRWVCRQLGTEPSDSTVEHAAEVRLAYYKNALIPRPGVIDVLATLKETGRKLAMMSVCSSEAPLLWARTPFAPLFDEAVFSCKVGLTKPDPRFYELVCEQLGVRPEHCLYVGDGGGRELTGAEGVGMDAVLICAPHEEEIVMARDEARNWTGLRIAAISEVLTLIDGAEHVG